MSALSSRLSTPLHRVFQESTSSRRTSKLCRAEVRVRAEKAGHESLKVTRRDMGRAAVMSAISASAQLPIVQAGMAAVAPVVACDSLEDARAQLLATIKSGGDEAQVQAAIDVLVPFNPTADPAFSPTLQGEWRLLWSSQVAEVTKATKDFPLPFQSIQLIGPGGGMEEGRAANLIRVFGGFVTLKLSSSAIPDVTNRAAVTIGPPFRLELLVGDRSFPIQNVESTEDERKAILGNEDNILGNELNEFSQLYFEDSGNPGDLRVSKVTAGDPVVIGTEFVHIRI